MSAPQIFRASPQAILARKQRTARVNRLQPTRREQCKLDQQIAADREARRLEKHRARQRRYRIRMKAKAKPKLTMAALAKLVGVSRMTLWRHGVGRDVTKTRDADVTKTRDAAFTLSLRRNALRPAFLDADVTEKRTLDSVLNTPEATRGSLPTAAASLPAAAASQIVSPYLFTGLAVHLTAIGIG